jgi:hypothetical protein
VVSQLIVGLARWLEGYLQAYLARSDRVNISRSPAKLKISSKANRCQIAISNINSTFSVSMNYRTDPLQTEIVFFLAEQARAKTWTDVELSQAFSSATRSEAIYRFRRLMSYVRSGTDDNRDKEKY